MSPAATRRLWAMGPPSRLGKIQNKSPAGNKFASSLSMGYKFHSVNFSGLNVMRPRRKVVLSLRERHRVAEPDGPFGRRTKQPSRGARRPLWAAHETSPALAEKFSGKKVNKPGRKVERISIFSNGINFVLQTAN